MAGRDRSAPGVRRESAAQQRPRQAGRSAVALARDLVTPVRHDVDSGALHPPPRLIVPLERERAPGTEREHANATIAAYRAAAGPLSTEELRGTAIAFLAAVAAELSVMSEFAAEDPAPRPFVTGLEAEPYVAADEDSADEETTEATTTTEGEQTTTEEQP